MHVWRIPYSAHQGLLAKAAPGTHEAAEEWVARLPIKKSLLDLGSGTGALLSRLSALGFKKKLGVEQNPETFQMKSVDVKHWDLNQPFARRMDHQFQCISAVEIIEHLDSPRAFLQEIYAALEPGGMAVISTPNIGHWLSRLQFLFTGVPKYFTMKDFDEQRHISPILDHHMEIMTKEIGFTLVEKQSTASSWGWGIQLLVAPVSLLFWLLGGQKTQGNVNLYLLKKAEQI